MAVPKKVQDRVGKKLFQCSLDTGDVVEARLLAKEKSAELYREWGIGVAPSHAANDPRSVAVRVGYDAMLAALEKRKIAWPVGDVEYAARLARRESDLRRLARRFREGDLRQWESAADRSIAKYEFPIIKGSDAYRTFIRIIAESSIDAISVFVRQAEGDLYASPQAPVVQEMKAREAATARSGDALMELFDRYAAQRRKEGKRQDSIDQDHIVVEQFAEFVGKNRRLPSITRNDVRDWRDTMVALPRNYRNSNAYKGLGMRAAAAKATKLSAPTLSPTTINKNLSALSPFFGWAIRNGYTEANHCDRLFFNVKRDVNQRDPFTVDQLNTILQSPLFTGFLKDGAEHKPGNVYADDWRKWIPLIAMFTGARIGEVAQLHTNDVECVHGRQFIHIRDDAKTGQRTKSGKSRMVPVHRTLEAIGFLHFHAGMDRGGQCQLFPELEANSRDHIGAVPSKFWRRYLGKIGVKEGSDGLGAHAFRHTMADELRAAGFLDQQFGPLILGHHKGSVTGQYGRIAQGTTDMLCAMIDGVEFKGVEFGHLTGA